MVFAVLGFSVPVFVLGYFLIYGFALGLHGCRCRAIARLHRARPLRRAHHAADHRRSAAIYIALIARMTRATVLEVLEEDYIRTARAKGLANQPCCCATRCGNAAVPIVTVIGLGVALLIGGVVVTESVFDIPGVGRLIVDAILKRDYPIIQGLICFFSFVYVVLNLIIDICLHAARSEDPLLSAGATSHRAQRCSAASGRSRRAIRS